MRVLLSINPVHVKNIMKGIKKFEFRRKIFARKNITTVVIYSTMPVGKIVGEFDIEEIFEDEPERLWESTAQGSGISKDFFDAYFDGREKGYALKIGELRIFDEPIVPSDIIEDFTPPQSYMYITGYGKEIRRQQQWNLI
ncbi:hypothetical protein [Brytella acorum]|uniref:ASCH domain-containing protein n=1 Tax=Brytella acorum TaxID=2959299 RepID=A0AA35Y371_9PROT|nr:hypothetical protein [Brytella acorum]MDF3623324.1 hypothetical protein [Brytella acorum]CAI9122318.1 hypothetical protein LMG32879_003178 [Brytella acorum]